MLWGCLQASGGLKKASQWHGGLFGVGTPVELPMGAAWLLDCCCNESCDCSVQWCTGEATCRLLPACTLLDAGCTLV